MTVHRPGVSFDRLSSFAAAILATVLIMVLMAPSASAQLTGRRFTFEPNNAALHSLSFDFTAGRLTYRLLGGGPRRGTHSLDFAPGAWVEGTTPLVLPLTIPPTVKLPLKVVSSGAWTAPDTFRLVLCQYETPFILTLDFTFASDQVSLRARSNAGFGPLEMPLLVGAASNS